METPYISAEDAAQLLSLTRRRINQLVAAGELQAQKIGNSNVILKESVDRFKKSRNGSKAKAA